MTHFVTAGLLALLLIAPPALARGSTVVDMKRDWKVIYPGDTPATH